MKMLFEGIAPAIVTPFQNGKIDYAAMRKLIRFQLDGGVAAIVVLGTTGEASTMTEEEKEEVIRFAKKEIGARAKMIVGTGTNSTAVSIERSLRAKELGADGIMCVTPYYNKCTQNGCVAHFQAIGDAVQIPIIVYNVPSRTGFNLSPEAMAKLADHPWIYGIKEANGDIVHIQKAMRVCRGKIAFYTGNDDLCYIYHTNGCQGAISVTANVYPDICVKVFNLVKEGKFAEAFRLNQTLFQVNFDLFLEVNPIPVKAALAHYGFCSDEVRLPLTVMEDANRAKLIRTLTEVR